MMHQLGGKVEKAPVREYGKIEVHVNTDSALFQGVSPKTICWMSHNDYISKEAPGFEISARTNDCPVAAVENKEKKLYAVQFHPEVLHTQEGTKCCQTKKAFSMSAESGSWSTHYMRISQKMIKKTPRRTSDPVFSARYKEHSLLRRRNIRLFSVHCRYNGHFSYNMPPVPEAVFFLPENTPPLRLSEQCKELH